MGDGPLITLHTLPPAFGQRDPSPFCLKVEMALVRLGLPFGVETTLNLRKAPKGKVPWIEDGGAVVANSEIILAHLDRKTHGRLFGDLSPTERAHGTAFTRLTEDHLYWIFVASRWLDDAWFEVVKRDFFSPLPFPLDRLLPILARRYIASDRLTVYDFSVASLLAAALTNVPATWVSELADREFPALRGYADLVQSETGVYCAQRP